MSSLGGSDKLTATQEDRRSPIIMQDNTVPANWASIAESLGQRITVLESFLQDSVQESITLREEVDLLKRRLTIAENYILRMKGENQQLRLEMVKQAKVASDSYQGLLHHYQLHYEFNEVPISKLLLEEPSPSRSPLSHRLDEEQPRSQAPSPAPLQQASGHTLFAVGKAPSGSSSVASEDYSPNSPKEAGARS